MINGKQNALFNDLQHLFNLLADTLTINPKSVSTGLFETKKGTLLLFQGRVTHELLETGSRQWLRTMDALKNSLREAGIPAIFMTERYSVYGGADIETIARGTPPKVTTFKNTMETRNLLRKNALDGSFTLRLPLQPAYVAKMESAVMHAVVHRGGILKQTAKHVPTGQDVETIHALLGRLQEPLRSQAVEKIHSHTGYHLL